MISCVKIHFIQKWYSVLGSQNVLLAAIWLFSCSIYIPFGWQCCWHNYLSFNFARSDILYWLFVCWVCLPLISSDLSNFFVIWKLNALKPCKGDHFHRYIQISSQNSIIRRFTPHQEEIHYHHLPYDHNSRDMHPMGSLLYLSNPYTFFDSL